MDFLFISEDQNVHKKMEDISILKDYLMTHPSLTQFKGQGSKLSSAPCCYDDMTYIICRAHPEQLFRNSTPLKDPFSAFVAMKCDWSKDIASSSHDVKETDDVKFVMKCPKC